MRSTRITGNVFVSNLPSGFTDTRLAEMFDAYGLVLFAYMARDAQTGTLRNHGLVDLAPAGAVSRAVADLDGRPIDGTPISVRAADPNLGLRPPAMARKARLEGSDPNVIARRPRQRAGGRAPADWIPGAHRLT